MDCNAPGESIDLWEVTIKPFENCGNVGRSHGDEELETLSVDNQRTKSCNNVRPGIAGSTLAFAIPDFVVDHILCRDI
jgi:hypothetical protein